MRSVQSTFELYVKLNKKIQPEVLMSVQAIEDGARLADPALRLDRGGQPQAAGEAVGDKRRLQRHDRPVLRQGLGDLLSHLRPLRHGIAPIFDTARAAACSASSSPPTR